MVEPLLEALPDLIVLVRRDGTVMACGGAFGGGSRALIGGFVIGGERGIRTLEGLLTLTPLAGARLRPLGHLSADEIYQLNQ